MATLTIKESKKVFELDWYDMVVGQWFNFDEAQNSIEAHRKVVEHYDCAPYNEKPRRYRIREVDEYEIHIQ